LWFYKDAAPTALVYRPTVRQIPAREFSRGRGTIHLLLGGESRGEDGRSTNLFRQLFNIFGKHRDRRIKIVEKFGSVF
jgi:hypothetical protein